MIRSRAERSPSANCLRHAANAGEIVSSESMRRLKTRGGGVRCVRASYSGFLEAYPLFPLLGPSLALSSRSGHAAAERSRPNIRRSAMSSMHVRGDFRQCRLRRVGVSQRHRRPPQPHRVLQIDQQETDTLRIILAAQIQLRRWRRGEPDRPSFRSLQRIRAIVAARESLLAQAVMRPGVLRSGPEYSFAAEPAFELVDPSISRQH